MQEFEAPISTCLASRWTILAPVAAAWLVVGIHSAAGFVFPLLWEWQFSGLVAIILMGATAGWIAPAGRQVLTLAVLGASLGLLTLFGGSEWFYYSPIFIPLALLLVFGLLAIGYVGGVFLRRFRVSRCTMLAVLSCILLAELTALFARDGYLLIRSARPRQVAFNDTDPSWFFYAPAERAVGLSYVALNCKPADPARAKRIFQKALYAADQIPNDNHNLLFLVAQAQVKATWFEDAAITIRHIRDRSQFELYFGIIAAEIAQHGGRSQAQHIFDQVIQLAQRQQDQAKRDRDLYLIGYREWEGGMYNEARQTAELIQAADSKADLLDRLNDSSQMEIACQQAQSGRFDEAAATVTQHVKDPYRHCDALMNVAMLAATNSHPDHARRILGEALQSAQHIESPAGRNSVIADIALRQFDLGFQADSQQTLGLIRQASIKDELVRKLARTP